MERQICLVVSELRERGETIARTRSAWRERYIIINREDFVHLQLRRQVRSSSYQRVKRNVTNCHNGTLHFLTLRCFDAPRIVRDQLFPTLATGSSMRQGSYVRYSCLRSHWTYGQPSEVHPSLFIPSAGAPLLLPS